MSKKNANGKAVEEALALLSALDDQQAAEVLASVKSPALAQALKARKDAESKKIQEQREALSKAMERIGKILDDCKVDKTVTFHRTDGGSWQYRIKKSSGGGSGGGSRGATLTDEMRQAIDGALDGKGKPKPDKDTIKESGAIGAFMFGDLRIPTSLICYHLIEKYDATTDDQIVKLVGSWGVRDTQARGALVRHKNQ